MSKYEKCTERQILHLSGERTSSTSTLNFDLGFDFGVVDLETNRLLDQIALCDWLNLGVVRSELGHGRRLVEGLGRQRLLVLIEQVRVLLRTSNRLGLFASQSA